MKYILIIDQIRTGGAERILLDYHNFLLQQGNTVKIFALSGNINQSEWTDGIDVIYGNEDNNDNLLLKTAQQLSIFFKLRKTVKAFQPDVIFSFLEKSNLLTILVPTKAKKTVSVHSILSEQYTKIKSGIIRKILYWILRKAYNSNINLIAVSNQVKEDLFKSFGVLPNKIYVVNNRVDKETILQKSTELIDNFNFAPDTKYILNIGRFTNVKAQWKLLKAFHFFKKNNPNIKVHLLLIGEGELKDKLISLATKLGESESISFLPFNKNPYKYMAKAHLFVLSSFYEGFPVVLAEASSLGIPFVGSTTAIPKEMFNNNDFWGSCVYEVLSTNTEFNLEIEDDEKELALLLKKGLFDNDFRNKFTRSIADWELKNNKDTQFEEYIRLSSM